MHLCGKERMKPVVAKLVLVDVKLRENNVREVSCSEQEDWSRMAKGAGIVLPT